jgi:multicomponent Na+:H+ antiporter subunit C
MIELISDRYIYVLVVLLLSVGLWGIVVERHLVKRLVALVVFQTAIFVFYIEGSVKDGATVPVIDEARGPDATVYVNPLPHLMILTALVVGVAVVGVALSLALRIYQAYGTLDERRIEEADARLHRDHADNAPAEGRAP